MEKNLEDDLTDKLKNLLKLKPQNDIELHVEEVRKEEKDKKKSNGFSI